MSGALEVALSGGFPEGAVLVGERILRRVLRFGHEGGEAYAKQHLFPFTRLRLRYALRASPSAKEAAQLREASRRGLLVPEVLGERTGRGLLGPRLAVLVTRALPEGRAPGLAERLAAIEDCADHGLMHPDLHGDNMKVLEDGRVALLDLQSVRFSKDPLGARDRARMWAKVLHDQASRDRSLTALLQADVAPEVLAGLSPPLGWSELRRRIHALEQARLASRRRHLLRSSTRTRAETRGLFGRRVSVRDASVPEQFGEETALHLGDRVIYRALSLKGGFRLRARGGLRELWLADQLSAETDGSPCLFYAWEREAPLPWTLQALYSGLSIDDAALANRLRRLLGSGPADPELSQDQAS